MSALELSPEQLHDFGRVCLSDFLAFTRAFFFEREGQKFIVAPHHKLLAHTLQRVVEGEIDRLIINIPPGYTKTEMAVINWIAWGLARNPRAKFMHISFSAELATLNSAVIRDLIQSELYQKLYPMQLRDDTAAKKRWNTTEGGGLMAVPTGGQLTGFRAGRMEPGFTGAIVIDDPLKPDDAYSETMRNSSNQRFTNTIKSRIALETVPIVIIMQRLHEEDLTGYLLTGGSGDMWHHLDLPVLIGEEQDEPTDHTHAIPIGYDLPLGPLWPFKHDQEAIDILRSDPYTYASQYMQRPAPVGGSVFQRDWWQYYNHYDYAENTIHSTAESDYTVELQYKYIFADTAIKTGQQHDWSVFQTWGMGADQNIYLLDQLRGKWEGPELRRNFFDFCARHEFARGTNQIGVRARYVEDKASGSGLIQEMNAVRGLNWVQGIQRDRDKVSRAISATPQIAGGRVFLPQNASWLDDYLLEFDKFTPQLSHKHDDQIDPTLDAIHQMLFGARFIPYADIL